MPSNTKKKSLVNKMTSFLEFSKADLMFGVTRGRCLTAKHFSLLTGLHDITGSRTFIDVLSHSVYCLDYDKTCQIETAQAIKTILSFMPRDEMCIVPTFFRSDNFN